MRVSLNHNYVVVDTVDTVQSFVTSSWHLHCFLRKHSSWKQQAFTPPSSTTTIRDSVGYSIHHLGQVLLWTFPIRMSVSLPQYSAAKRQRSRAKWQNRPLATVSEKTGVTRSAENPFGFGVLDGRPAAQPNAQENLTGTSHYTNARYNRHRRNDRIRSPKPFHGGQSDPNVRHIPANPSYEPLPVDHPLIVEREELRRVREDRKMYWVALAERLGKEWDNPDCSMLQAMLLVTVLANVDLHQWTDNDSM
jgi:hypothetical protein